MVKFLLIPTCVGAQMVTAQVLALPLSLENLFIHIIGSPCLAWCQAPSTPLGLQPYNVCQVFAYML